MSLLLSCQSVSKSFSTRRLFEELSVSIFSKDKVGLIGPNGSGKSTFLKILAGLETCDEGILSPRKGLRIGYVPQTCEFKAFPPKQILIDSVTGKLEDYEKENLAETWLSKLGFTGTEPCASLLSGGWKKRLAFGQVMMNDPELILFDEPTNHLDLEGILWLEKFLAKEAPAFLLVSHDRTFLQNAVNRVIEINTAYPKGMFSIDGPYLHFLEKKEAFLQGQLQQERSIATRARRETEWLRQGVKARTTKSGARIDEAHEILQEHAKIRERNRQKRAGINFAASERETRKLLSAKNLMKKAGDRVLFERLDFLLSPGTRIGLMGPNGSGKTTLLRLLAGETSPDQGTLKRAEDLKVVYFDQHRASLPSDMTLKEALSPKGDYVTFLDQKVHVNGWCKRFLFSPDLLPLKIGTLSGGERARIAIAHLMLQPADLLLLDEPTNDLDIPTLETLEESLLEFPGALVLITHDRFMLERLCNTLIALGDSPTPRLFADYSQWEASQTASSPSSPKPTQKAPSTKSALTYREKKEYEGIESKITALEEEVRRLNHLLEQPDVVLNSQKLSETCQAIGLAETKIEQLYLRWQELERLD